MRPREAWGSLGELDELGMPSTFQTQHEDAHAISSQGQDNGMSPPPSFPRLSAWPLTSTDPSTLATSARSKGCVKHGQHTSNGTQGPGPMGKPRATQGLHSPPPCPTPWRKSGTKETQNKNQE